MKYTTYYENNETITYEHYDEMMQGLLQEENSKIVQDVVMRKVIFQSPVRDMEDSQESVTYSICMKDFKMNELYVERKSMQKSLVFKSYVKISRKECNKILNRDIAWMKTSSKSLIQDFYLEMTLNDLVPVVLEETIRDICEKAKEDDGVVFYKSVKVAKNCYTDFFNKELPMMDCLNCDSVILSYKKTVKIPSAISSIIHICNPKARTLAYSL